MRVLLDPNIILDEVLRREPFYTDADALFQQTRTGKIIGYVTATSLTDIFYIARKQKNSAVANK